jgi:hypothetical protein
MKQNAFLDQSILIASKIEDELAVLSKRKSRGVKQAGFWVLYKTAMPSLLAEIGFISNPTEEQYLAGEAGQTNIATSVYKAFRAYKYEIEGRKDTPIVAAKTPAVEKKKEQLAEESAQPSLKVSPVNPTKQSQEAEAAKQTEQSHQTAKKEEKAWEPDTTAHIERAPDVYRDKVAASNTQPMDKMTNPIAKDTVEVKPKSATSAETMTKKLVPVRTANEPGTTAKKEVIIKPAAESPIVVSEASKVIPKKEETKPAVKEIKEETKAVAKSKEPVKPAADSTKIKAALAKAKSDSLRAEAKAKREAAIAKAKEDSIRIVTAKREAWKAKTDSIKAAAAAKRENALAKAKADSIRIVTDKKEAVNAARAKADSIKTANAQKTATAKKEPAAKTVTKKELTPTAAKAPQGEDVMFTVQILAAHKPPKNYDDLVNSFGLINREDIGDGVVRYMAGQYTHYKDAQKTLELAKAKGFPTAFIIGYVNDVRLDGKQTKELGLKYP